MRGAGAVAHRLLLRLDPETAHRAGLVLLAWLGAGAPGRWALRAVAGGPPESAPVHLMGLKFPNRLGLAAGYDKDAVAIAGVACLGFGHVEVGSVTRHAQSGRPRPRLFRLAAERALVNRMGFPSLGGEAMLRRLATRRRPAGIVLGVSLGLGVRTPLESAAEEYAGLAHRLGPLADYVAVNVSSPNTTGLRTLQERRLLEGLLRQVVDALGQNRTPLVVKLSPDLSPAGLDQALEAALGAGAAGVVMGNTTTGRAGVFSPAAKESGGLSGRPLFPLALEQVRRVVAQVKGRLVVIACGGVSTRDEFSEMLDAGADLVQVYTALVFRGPRLAGELLGDQEWEGKRNGPPGVGGRCAQRRPTAQGS